MGNPHNQQKFRITGHLIDGADDLQKKFSFEGLNDVHRTGLRASILCPEWVAAVAEIAKQPLTVQAIIDEMIYEQAQKGVSLSDLDLEAWVQASIIEATARAAKEPDRFYLLIDSEDGPRKLGPHRLDLIRQWVAQDIVDESWLIVPERGTKPHVVGFFPAFFEYGPDVNARVDKINREKLRKPIEPMTPRQEMKLEYFRIPYPKHGLNKARANEILTVFAIMDPETERRYQRSKDL